MESKNKDHNYAVRLACTKLISWMVANDISLRTIFLRYFCLLWNSIQWQKIPSFSKAKSLQINLIFRLRKDWWKSEIFNILQSHLWAKCLDFRQNECWILPFCCYLIISGVQSVIVLTYMQKLYVHMFMVMCAGGAGFSDWFDRNWYSILNPGW